jgi:hypothetical protein
MTHGTTLIMTGNQNDFSETILLFRDFIRGDEKLYTFLHNTDTEEMARHIMKHGLLFENHLLNTSDHVSGTDLVELNNFRMIRKYYGNYTIVIQISSRLVEDFSRRLKETHYHFSEALSKTRPSYNKEENPVYVLPEQFVRGYFDHLQNKGVDNPRFDPWYFPLYFEDNLQRLLRDHRIKHREK